MMTTMHARGRWGPRLGAFGVWAAAAACAVYWGLRLTASAASLAAPVAVVDPDAVALDETALVRLLGVSQPAPAAPSAPAGAASRLSLLGVVAAGADKADKADKADRADRAGLALIALEGKPARLVRVGARLDESYVLQSVSARSAVLAASMDAPAALTLELRPLSPAAQFDGAAALPATTSPRLAP